MTTMTYILQVFAAIFASAVAFLMIISIANGQWSLVPLQGVILAVNIALFIWQGSMR